MSDAYLALEDGRVVGTRGRAPGRTCDELVFITAHTGYEESLTDPSYEEQVLTFSYSFIGNYGVRAERLEPDRAHPRAAIAREFIEGVVERLADEGVPAADHLDTCDLVTPIREKDTIKVGIAVGEDVMSEDVKEELAQCKGMSEHVNIGAQVIMAELTTFEGDGDTAVALVDCGAKGSIVDSLVDHGVTVRVPPYDTGTEDVPAPDPDVLFVSNGPGDPENYTATHNLVEGFAGEAPLTGICFGQQIVASALGGATEKMALGHHGINQPVRDLQTGKVVMTTQNHGYIVADPDGKPDVTQVNVNDDIAEGLASGELSAITCQYHLEAHPGPHDSLGFFDDVLAMTGTEGNEHKSRAVASD